MIVRESQGDVERVKLLDFGIAKLDVQRLNLDDPMTRTGVIMGTPHYMSPEQCQGAGHVDDRADVYSLGIIVYQMLTGRLPFLGEGDGAIIAKHIYVPPDPPRSLVPSITDGMQELVLAMLIKDPRGRPSMLHVHRRLEEMGAGFGMTQDLSMTFEEAPPTGQVPEPQTVVRGLSAANIPSQPSTLGSVTGQMAQAALPTRRPLLAGAAFIGLALLGAGGAIAYKLTRPAPAELARHDDPGTSAAAAGPATAADGHGDPTRAPSAPTTKPPPPEAPQPTAKPPPPTAKPKAPVKKLQRAKPKASKKKAAAKKGKKPAKGKGARPGVGIVD
ncbi:MAG: protein kinase [Polyangia bacterium]